MMLRKSAVALCLLAAACSPPAPERKSKEQPRALDSVAPPATAVAQPSIAVPASYTYSALYRRVDLSFSNIPIDTPFGAVKQDLSEIREDGCEANGDCSWFDRTKVRHYFYPVDDPTGAIRNSDGLVIKMVSAADFDSRPIAALGIGLARNKNEVLANVRKFLPGVTLDWTPPASGNVGMDECSGSVDPGWFQIGFDKQGRLEAVRFDAYHFT